MNRIDVTLNRLLKILAIITLVCLSKFLIAPPEINIYHSGFIGDYAVKRTIPLSK